MTITDTHHRPDHHLCESNPKPTFVSCWRYSCAWLCICAVAIILTAIYF